METRQCISIITRTTQGMVNLSPEQYRRITASQGGGNADEGRDAGSGSGSGSDGGEEVEMVKVEFKPDELLLADNDVLLTTYEVLRSKQALFRKVSSRPDVGSTEAPVFLGVLKDTRTFLERRALCNMVIVMNREKWGGGGEGGRSQGALYGS